MKIHNYINKNWVNCIRYTPNDSETHIGLPYKYTVPCCDKTNFNELYYWDTYFTNKGLLLDGHIELAKSNCQNIFYLVEKFGYMPNGSCFHYLGRSQPPYLAFMVYDIYKTENDNKWLLYALSFLKKEYEFWMKERKTPNGLNRYYANYNDEECEKFFYDVVVKRVKINAEEYDKSARIKCGRHFMAEAESGWDFNPRFYGRCSDFNPVDLNSNLYFYETLLEFIDKLNGGDGKEYKAAYGKRAAKMKELLWNEENKVFYDYDFVNGRRSDVISAASFQPYFVNMENIDCGGAKTLYEKLIEENGVSTTVKGYGKYQWAYPNAWAPCQLIAFDALKNAGYKKEAQSVAEKYLHTVESVYDKTGNLWEKYNATSDETPVNEYDMPPMLGWTAGTYLYLNNKLKKIEGKSL